VLLVIDVGNTNIVLGIMKDDEVLHHWRLTTCTRTTDEFGLLLLQLMAVQGVLPRHVRGAIISCVVPSTLYAIEKACRRYLELDAMIVGRGLKTGMRVRMDNPREVGADRIVNAVAAVERYGGPIVVADFGTATTFDCINGDGDYVGGVISPGYQISADALFTRTSKLPRIELERPKKVVGTNTVHSMQSGLYWGYVGLINGLASLCKAELGPGTRCIATGGLANLFSQDATEIEHVDDFLTLVGLRILFDRNQE